MSTQISPDRTSVPSAAWRLGLAGLLPTLAAVLFIGIGPSSWQPVVIPIAIGYGALILSFLGGAWWGCASTRAAPAALKPWLAISVVPSLAAWLALSVGAPAGLWLLATLFLLALVVDRRLLRAALAPTWWWSLRWPLSTGMAALHAMLAWLASSPA